MSMRYSVVGLGKLGCSMAAAIASRGFSVIGVDVNHAANALRQVALNLLSNGLQAMPTGGRLTISTACPAEDRVEFRVADTGPGVSPEDRAHLFEPFFTTKPDGTGLGLALCREIVTQHGGRIDLEAGDGPGAVFRVELPVTEAARKSLP